MKNLKSILIAVIAIILLGSCASLSSSSETASWKAVKRTKGRGTIRITSVSAEKPGEWGSLEKEVNALMPLLLYENRYITVSSDVPADYSAVVTVREREYLIKWKTRRYLSAEVRIWAGDDVYNQPLPLSTGRVLLYHEKPGFVSSGTLSVMLRRAVRNAVSGLPRKNRALVFAGEKYAGEKQ